MSETIMNHMAIGPISPLPWRAVFPDTQHGCIRIIDANGKNTGIDAFPTRPGCDADQVKASVAVMVEVMNAFGKNETSQQ